jgi:hypothetical protein
LTLQPADATRPGGVSTTTQTFAGDKTHTGDVTISKTTPTLSFTGVASLGTTGSTALNFKVNNATAAYLEAPTATSTTGTMFVGNTRAVIDAAAQTNTDTYGLGVYSLDSVATTTRDYGAGINQYHKINSTAQAAGQIRSAFSTELDLSPASKVTYDGIYYGFVGFASNTNVDILTGTSKLIGASFYGANSGAGTTTRKLIGGEFTAANFAAGEVQNAYAGSFNGSQATGTGSAAHVAAGIVIGDQQDGIPITASGSSTSNEAYGLWIKSGAISASGTANDTYSIKSDATSKSVFAGPLTATTLTSASATPTLDFTGGTTVLGTTDSNALSFKSNGTVGAYLNTDGSFTIGGTKAQLAPAAPSMRLSVKVTDTAVPTPFNSDYASLIKFQLNPTASHASSSYKNGQFLELNINASSNLIDLAGNYSGVQDYISVDRGNITGGINGGESSAQHYGDGYVASGIGHKAYVYNGGNGEIRVAKGLAIPTVHATGTGSTAHSAIGISIGSDNYGNGEVLSSGSSTSNTSIGIDILNVISASGTSNSCYAVRSQSTCQSTYAGSLSSTALTVSGLTTAGPVSTNSSGVISSAAQLEATTVKGATLTVTAGENLALGDAVYISVGSADGSRTTGRAYKLDVTNDNRMEFVGIAPAAITSGSTGLIQVSGLVTGLSGLTLGMPAYGSTTSAGGLQVTAPSVAGQWIIQLGVAISTTTLAINGAASATAVAVSSGSSGVIEAISTKTGDYTVTTSDYNILCDASSGPVTITSFAATSNAGRAFCVSKIDASGNACTVAFGDLANGDATMVLSEQYVSQCYKTNGSTFYAF